MPLSIALSTFDIATLIAVIGMLACQITILPRAIDAALARNLHRMLGCALALLTLASFGILLSRTLEMNGGVWHVLWRDAWLTLTDTHFGHVWRWRALALAWAIWAWSSRHRGAWSTWVMAIAIALIALTRSETGHFVRHGDFTLAVWIDGLHILAAGTWVGTLFGMTLAIFPSLPREGKHSLENAAAMFQRLFTLSGIALAVLVACGVFTATRQLGSFEALWTSRYGIILDVKMALVLTMIAIGAYNRYVRLPQLRASAAEPEQRPLASQGLSEHASASSARDAGQILRSCVRGVLIESLLVIAVIGATGTLNYATPPTAVTHLYTVRQEHRAP